MHDSNLLPQVWADSRVTKYIDQRLSELGVTDEALAPSNAISTRMLTIIRSGQIRVNLSVVLALADILQTAPDLLCRMVLEDHYAELHAILTTSRIMASTSPATKTDIAAGLAALTAGGSDTFVDLNYKVTPRFHKRFKLEATLRGMSMKELLEASFSSYLEQNGGSIERPKEGLL